MGVAVGVSDGLLSTVSRDATSGIYCPANAAEWATVMGVAGVTTGGPSATYLFQDASGSPADSIGSFTLTVNGTAPTYRAAVLGWSRASIVIADGATTNLRNTDAGLPDISTASMSILMYSKIANAGAIRARGALGTTFIGDAVAASGAASIRVTGDGTQDGAVDSTGAVRPTWLTINRTTSSETLVNDLEKVSLAFSGAPTGKSVRFGSSTNAPGLCNYLYGALFFSGAAELTDAQRKRVLQVLGWAIPWN